MAPPLTPAPRPVAERRPPPTGAFERPSAPPTAAERLRRAIGEVLDVTGTGWRAVLVGSLLIGMALGTLYWLTRQQPVPVDGTLPVVEPAAVTTTSTTTSPPGPVLVHVAGAVRDPGVHELPADAHVVDAVDAAGGLTDDADSGRINLAATVVDGSQIYVPAAGEVPPAVAGSSDGDGVGEGEGGPIDLNTADGPALETLPGVGPATASAIIDHRDRNGPFTAVEDLMDVRGIGEAKLAQLRDLVRV